MKVFMQKGRPGRWAVLTLLILPLLLAGCLVQTGRDQAKPVPMAINCVAVLPAALQPDLQYANLQPGRLDQGLLVLDRVAAVELAGRQQVRLISPVALERVEPGKGRLAELR